MVPYYIEVWKAMKDVWPEAGDDLGGWSMSLRRSLDMVIKFYGFWEIGKMDGSLLSWEFYTVVYACREEWKMMRSNE
jgi:hypothetical protein